MARSLFFVLALFFTALHTLAQSKEMPAPVKETFSAQYPNAGDIVYRDNLLNSSVEFTVNGEKMVASYTKKGVWKGSEKDWSYDKLSEGVKDGFSKSKYADWKVEETKIIYRPGGMERFRIKVGKSDLQKKYLFFNKEGRLVDEQLTI